MRGIIRSLTHYITPTPQPQKAPETSSSSLQVNSLIENYTKLCVNALPARVINARTILCTECPQDLARLCGHPLAKSIMVEQNQLIVTTHMITMSKNGYSKKIGEYLVIVSSYARSPLHCINRTVRMAGNHGPHIRPDGTFCMDQSSFEYVCTLTRRGKLGDVALFALDILPLTNGIPVADASFEHWPRI